MWTSRHATAGNSYAVSTLRYSLITIFIGVLGWYGRHVAPDDAFIYARYIRNALQGHGLVFNANEQVNALTSPLYCYLWYGLAKLLHGNVLLASRILYLFLFWVACTFAERLAPYAGVLASATAYFYSMQGMETSLFLLFLALVLLLYWNERWNWLPLVYVLLTLTRFEGALLAAILFSLQVYRKKLSSAVSYIPAVCVVAVYCALNFYWYGKILPQSASAKIGQGAAGFWGPWPTAFFAPIFTHVSPLLIMTPVIAVLAWRGFVKAKRQHSEWIFPLAAFLVGLLSFYVLFNLPGYPWYYAPFIFFGIVIAALAIPNRISWTVLTCTAAVLLCAISAHWLKAKGPNSDYVQIDDWLLKYAPPQSRIGTAETGLIGWQLKDYYIIDNVGLTTPKNATYTAHRQFDRWFDEDKPDYVFVHRSIWPWEEAVTHDPGYVRVLQFRATGLYARKELAVHSGVP